jgi:putative 2OG-Fe(II) oxygenase
MTDASQLVEQLKRDGFVFFRDVFSPEMVDRAHQELLEWFNKDLVDRQQTNLTNEIQHTGSAGPTQLSKPSHLLLDSYAKSPTLDQMINTILTHPTSAAVLERMVGKNYKLRGYNVRRMTGNHDPAPSSSVEPALPHEWHRDSLGEVGIGLLLTDVPPGGNGGTALVPGSHLYPYCPRWNTLFSPFYRCALLQDGISWLARCNLFNRMLARRVLANATEATGLRGDFYFFFNDTWHGRYPNVHQRQSMVVLVGLFPAEIPFPDKVAQPGPETLARLPPAVRRAVNPDQPGNPKGESLIYWMLANRQRLHKFSLFHLAALERKLANVVSRPLLSVRKLVSRLAAG